MKSKTWWLGAVLAFALVAAACGTSDDTTTTAAQATTTTAAACGTTPIRRSAWGYTHGIQPAVGVRLSTGRFASGS